MKGETSGAQRMMLIVGGWVCVGLGTMGIFLPLLPTTCFLLMAGWCFGKSSPRFDRWLHENRLFGAYLTSYKAHRTIPARVKVLCLPSLWGSMALSVLLLTPPLWVDALLLVIAAAVSLHVGKLSTSEAFA